MYKKIREIGHYKFNLWPISECLVPKNTGKLHLKKCKENRLSNIWILCRRTDHLRIFRCINGRAETLILTKL